MGTPATRSLENVLRQLARPADGARVLIGAYVAGTPSDSAHALVSIGGATVEVPKIPGQAVGSPAYLLAWPGHLLAVSTGPAGPAGPTGPTGPAGPTGPTGPVSLVVKAGAPTAGDGVNGAIYLDSTSLRLWGPKAAGAWPGSAFARVMPLTPTYAQLKAG